jgi:RecA/RadA recombinase
MSKRERPKITKTSYFVSEKPGINFISSGCTLLDCALGGGYAIGRIVNFVGDNSTA